MKRDSRKGLPIVIDSKVGPEGSITLEAKSVDRHRHFGLH